MTTVYMNPVLAACLFKAAQKLGAGIWQPHNPAQVKLIEQLPELERLIAAMPAGMLESIGSTDATAINDFLVTHNLDIRLPEFKPDEFGTAAVLEVLSKWQVPGAECMIGRHAAVEMQGRNVVVTTTAAGVDVIEPVTDQLRGDCRVLLVQANTLEDGLAYIAAPRERADEIKGVKFPMVDSNVLVDISWLVGLTHGDARLSHAVAQAKLRLDHLGAHAKAGAAIVVTRSMGGPRTIVIDGPFVVAFVINDRVAVAFHVDKADWKKPPGLGVKSVGETW